MKFPSIAAVAAELREINTGESFPDHDGDCYIDVRLQVYPDGTWAVRSGDSSYDLDHRGYWGASFVPGNGRRFSSEEIARDLLTQARDDHAQSQPAPRYCAKCGLGMAQRQTTETCPRCK